MSSTLLSLGEHWEASGVLGVITVLWNRKTYLCICIGAAFAEDLLTFCLVLSARQSFGLLFSTLQYCTVLQFVPTHQSTSAHSCLAACSNDSEISMGFVAFMSG